MKLRSFVSLMLLLFVALLVGCSVDPIGIDDQQNGNSTIDPSKMVNGPVPEAEFNKMVASDKTIGAVIARTVKRRKMRNFSTVEYDNPDITTFTPPYFSGSVPSSYIIPQNRQPRILHQYTFPACQTFAAAYAYSIVNAIEYDLDPSLPENQYAPNFIWSQFPVTKTTSGLGNISIFGCDTLADFSTGMSGTWLVSDSVKPDAASKARALKHRKFGYYAIKRDQYYIERCRSILAAGYPIVARFDMYPDFEAIDANWRSRNPTAFKNIGQTNMYDKTSESGSKFSMGHVVVLIGYDDARQAFIFANSWGSHWGIDIPGHTSTAGYGYISYNMCRDSSKVRFQAFFPYINAPYIKNLKHGEVMVKADNKVTFKWEEAPFAIGYQLYLNGKVAWQTGRNGISSITLPVEPGKTYDWYINARIRKSVSGSIKIEWRRSPLTATFKVTSASNMSLYGLEDDSTVRSPLINWSARLDQTRYEVYVSSNSAPSGHPENFTFHKKYDGTDYQLQLNDLQVGWNKVIVKAFNGATLIDSVEKRFYVRHNNWGVPGWRPEFPENEFTSSYGRTFYVDGSGRVYTAHEKNITTTAAQFIIKYSLANFHLGVSFQLKGSNKYLYVGADKKLYVGLVDTTDSARTWAASFFIAAPMGKADPNPKWYQLSLESCLYPNHFVAFGANDYDSAQQAVVLHASRMNSKNGVINVPDAISWDQTPNFLNRRMYVSGRVYSTYKAKNGSAIFLDFHPNVLNTFSAVILKKDFHRFSADLLTKYRGKRILMKGFVSKYKNRPQILVRIPEQITLLGD